MAKSVLLARCLCGNSGKTRWSRFLS